MTNFIGPWIPIHMAPIDQTNIIATHESSGIQYICWREQVGSDTYIVPGTDRVWKPTHFQFCPENIKTFMRRSNV